MQKNLMGAALLAATLLVATAQPADAQATGEVVSRYSSIWTHDCMETGDGSAEDQDWVSYRCDGQGGIDVFLFFSDGVRLSVGFGDGTAPFMGYRADREQNWPVEWRGRTTNGMFVPRAAIIRMKTHPEDESGAGSELVVFGLGRTPCVLGTVRGVQANEQAQRLADTGTC